MSPFPSIALCVFLVVCAFFDLLSGRIPNRLTYPAMVVALLFQGITGGWAGLAQGLGGLAAGMAFLMPVYLLQGMGAGDVKLMGVVGAFLGPVEAFHAFLWIGVTGGLYALILLAMHPHQLVIFLKNCLHRFIFVGKVFLYGMSAARILTPPREETLQGPEGLKLRYGVAIALGTVAYLLWHRAGHSGWSQFVSAVSSRLF